MPPRVRIILVLAGALFCIGWIFLHAFLIDAVTVRLCERVDRGVPAAERLPVFLPEFALDGYLWIQHALDLGRESEWRIRHTDFDNYPQGREVHWSSAYAWYVRGLGRAFAEVTGESLRNGVHRAAIWANPLILALSLGVFVILVARQYGGIAGLLTGLGMVAAPNFYGSFAPANPDHHGLIAVAILGLLLGLSAAAFGWSAGTGDNDSAAARGPSGARVSMVFSAFCGGACLWLSAISAAIVLTAVGCAALLGGIAACRFRWARGLRFHPELWVLWGRTGAAVSLAFFLLEYFPHHPAMRLEVNHPFHALSWLGGANVIAMITSRLGDPNPSRITFSVPKLALAGLAALMLPVAILIGGEAVFTPLDPFLAKLHTYVIEFLPLGETLRRAGYAWHGAYLYYPLTIVTGVLLLCGKRIGKATKLVIASLLTVIFFISACMLHQARWGILAEPAYVLLNAIAFSCLSQSLRGRGLFRLACVGAAALAGLYILLAQAGAVFPMPLQQLLARESIRANPVQTRALLHRDIAQALRYYAGPDRVVVLSGLNSSTMIAGLGGFHTIGTLYWENESGLRAAASIFSAQTDQEALELVRSHQITHIVLMNWQNSVEPYFESLHRNPEAGVSLANSFGSRLIVDGHLPHWLRPLPYPENAMMRALNETVLLLEVVDWQ